MSSVSDYRRPATPGRTSLLESAVTMVALTGALWVLELLDVLSGHRLDGLGVRTRDWSDLWSVFTLPLAHADWTHLIANTLPFFVLGLFVLASGTVREFVMSGLIIVLVSGLAAWLLSPDFTNTLGASGVVFGWLTYLLVRGFYTRKGSQIFLAIVVFVGFGALLWGVLPGTPGVSWQGHLGGAVGGVLAARVLHKRA
ncbi:MAG: rhomboid family intramembrane serine protease [Myxococcales bacterium]|nr:MAG: rhomboid family intramembrane serine protease [Myxococcales bacterium]